MKRLLKNTTRLSNNPQMLQCLAHSHNTNLWYIILCYKRYPAVWATAAANLRARKIITIKYDAPINKIYFPTLPTQYANMQFPKQAFRQIYRALEGNHP